ncbi:MAG: hypothetical protein AB1521_08685 [Bacteroidota bacterium]
MQTFEYSSSAKLIYRYGNFIITPLLSVHLVSSIFLVMKEWYFIILAVINLTILIITNVYYIKTYRLFPFKIITDNEKMICSNFFLSKKKIEIKHADISKIDGGIFSAYPTRPIYITDGKNNITVGFYSHVSKFQKLLTIILSNIPQKLYNDLIDKIKKK